MTQLETKAKLVFEKAFAEFLNIEKDNITNGVSERNLCGRLSMYIQKFLNEKELNNYFVDPEYNRKQGGEIKTILDEEMQIIPIQCDIVVHTRGREIGNDNLIAIEMKKAVRPQAEKINDKNRLRALTKDSYDGVWSADGKTHPEHVCGYVLGIYIEIDSKQSFSLVELYKKGERFLEASINF